MQPTKTLSAIEDLRTLQASYDTLVSEYSAFCTSVETIAQQAASTALAPPEDCAAALEELLSNL